MSAISASADLDATAVVLREAFSLGLDRVALNEPAPGEVVVAVECSGISTGTERLFWNGRMPPFPGMGYPLVPGYESVGRVIRTEGDAQGLEVGERVFVPGAQCYRDVRGLFGGASSRLVVAGGRAVRVSDRLGDEAVLLALAATAQHALSDLDTLPELIVGHGALGRLLARICVARGEEPVVWERDPARRDGARGYRVIDPAGDTRRDYRCVCDVSGSIEVLDTLVGRMAPRGELVLAGFYEEDVRFRFAPAFMREIRLRIAAQWQPVDMDETLELAESGALSLDGIITHREPATEAVSAYERAFNDAGCLKMVLDWRTTE